MNSPLGDAIAFLFALFAMEAVAWATHRYLMHGPLWILHKSHHSPRGERGPLEWNDLFAVAFALAAILCFWLGGRPGRAWLWFVGAGASAYGCLYALFHDGLVHRRWPFPVEVRSGLMKRLVDAHHLHHATRTRTGAVSFGFLCPRPTARLRAELRRRREAA